MHSTRIIDPGKFFRRFPNDPLADCLEYQIPIRELLSRHWVRKEVNDRIIVGVGIFGMICSMK